MIEAATNVVNPAAGPETAKEEPLISDTTNPPMIPAISPPAKGAPEANATPKHKGSATKKTESPAVKSCLIQIMR